jgi:hypothetical protein
MLFLEKPEIGFVDHELSPTYRELVRTVLTPSVWGGIQRVVIGCDDVFSYDTWWRSYSYSQYMCYVRLT